MTPKNVVLAVGLGILGGAAWAADDYPDWGDDSAREVLRSGTGECWRTGTWNLKSKNPPGCLQPVAAADSDGDGVSDANDNCPGTPAGMRVGATGCAIDSDGDGVIDAEDRCPGTPRGTPVDRQGCEKDSDGDGVLDSADRCPGTPPGTAVDARGCARDSDGDGVIDSADRCPGTAAGVRVNAAGCEVIEHITLAAGADSAEALFEIDSANLTPAAKRALDDVAARLRGAGPVQGIGITGHTDDTGAADYNRDLSLRRAEAVRDYLAAQGVERGKMQVRGAGEDEPVASNATREGRSQNRRVDIDVRN